MLKKLNGKITKLLFYIKNNLVSCVFKFSILSTMLILVYLVCMLSQTDSVMSSSDNNDVYPMESSQKLMLTIPTEIPEDIPSDFNALYSTTDSLATIMENSISKTDKIDIGTDPFFPLQEPTTTPIPSLDPTTPSILRQEELPETTIVATSVEETTAAEAELISTLTGATTTDSTLYQSEAQEITTSKTITRITAPVIPTIAIPAYIVSTHSNPTTAIPVPAIPASAVPETHNTLLAIRDAYIPASTVPEPAISASTIPEADILAPVIPAFTMTEPAFHAPTIPVVPFKRSLSLEELKLFENTTRESTTEAQIKSTTPTIDLLEEPKEENQDLSTNLLTSSHPDDAENAHPSTSTAPAITIPPQVSDDDLFMDNWANNLSAENEDIQHDPIEELSSHLQLMQEPTKSLFQNEDSKLASIEAPILDNESNVSLDNKSSPSPLVNSDIEDDTSHNRNFDIQEPYKIFSPKNLLNLFAFDHQPSPSNVKATWWPQAKGSMLAESAAKNHRKRANRVLPNADSQDMTGNLRMFNQMQQLQGFDTLNAKLKNSVSILEKLFGNFIQ